MSVRTCPHCGGEVEVGFSREGYLGVREVADYLGMSQDWVLDRVHDESLPATRLGRVIKIRLADVDAAIADGKFDPGQRQAARLRSAGASR